MSVSLNTLSTSKQDKLTAGTGISISGSTISCTVKAPSDYVKKDNGSLAIGSFAYLSTVSGNSVSNGSTIAGSNLTACYFQRTIDDNSVRGSVSSAASGTWRNVNGSTVGGTGIKHTYFGLFQRIS